MLRVDGRRALDAFATLHDAMAGLGPEAASLLAEPIFSAAAGETGDGAISWYSELAGNAAPLATLPAERRELVEQRLRNALRQLDPLLRRPDLGPTLRAALCVREPGAIWAVDERPVLTEWGMVPDGASLADPQSLLPRSPLAPYLPPPAPAEPQPVAAPMPEPVPLNAAPTVQSRRRAPWFVIPAALALAALCLLLGYWRASVVAAERAAERNPVVTVLDPAAGRQALERQEALNAGMEREIERRRKLLEGDVCVLDPATAPRIGPDRAAVPSPVVVPPPPGGAPFRGTLADLLKQAIVMVLVGGDGDNSSLGTGFFITPELIATNRHVVEHAVDGKAVVLNLKLGHPIEAQIVAMSPNSDIGSLDIALLKVPAVAGVQPLTFSTAASELDMVIAAGYPPLITGADGALRRLLVDGDLSAAPQLIMTDGRIQAIQTSQAGVKIMPHGAAVSAGNSGGPLVDACGRVVGIVTFIRADAASAAHANFALKTDSLLPFLREHGAAVTENNEPCAPGSQAAPATPAAAPPAASPTP